MVNDLDEFRVCLIALYDIFLYVHKVFDIRFEWPTPLLNRPMCVCCSFLNVWMMIAWVCWAVSKLCCGIA